MKNYTKLLICFIFISTYGKAQFFGVGQANPSNTLHVTPINVGDEPVRIEGLQSAAAIDSAFISFDPLTGVLKALSLAELKALVNDNNVNYSAGSGISISGGIISNLGDADSDPSNEYNTAFSITGNVISLTDGGGVKTINLPPSSGNDHDWYGEGTTSSPTAITDNIFTQGNVGIGNISPLSQLEVFSGASESVLRLSTSSNLNLQLDGGTGFHQFMRYAENGVNKWEVGNASAHSNKFYFNPNAMSSIFGSVMVIEQNGNVGIGTTSPASKLHIGATTATHPLSTGNFISATSNSSDNKPVAYFETGGDAIGEPAIFAYGRGTTPITDVVTISANGTSNSNYNLLNLVHGETSAGGDGTSVMVVKGDGNVGIGTTAPARSLHIESQIPLRMTRDVSGVKHGGEFSIDANRVHLFGITAGVISTTPLMTWRHDNGNIGVGTTTPGEKLEVNGSIRMTDGNEGNGKIMVSDANGTGSWQDASAISTSSMVDLDGDTKIQVEESSDEDIIRFDTQGSERMIISSTGNVGIGTTTPGKLLQIEKTLSGDNAQLSLSNGLGAEFQLGITGSDANQNSFIKTHADEDLYFQIGQATNNANPDVVIKASGNVGIGTTMPDFTMDVTRENNWNGIVIDTYKDAKASDYTSILDLRSAGGTESSPTNILTNERLGEVKFSGHDGSDFGNHQAIIRAWSEEDFTATSKATKLEFNTTPSGTLNSIPRMTITGDGNVGIGTTTPDSKVQIGTGTNSLRLNPFSVVDIKINSLLPGSKFGGILEGGDNGNLVIGIRDNDDNDGFYIFSGNGFMTDSIYDVPILAAKATGDVGIGTTLPGEKLEVRGNLRIGGTDTINYIAFHGTSGDQPGNFNHGYIGERIYSLPEASELFIFKGNDHEGNPSGSDRIRLASNSIAFDTYSNTTNGTFEDVATDANVTTKMVIKQNGNVGIGTTTPSEKLHVSSNTSEDAVVLIEADTDNNNEADNPRINMVQDAGTTGVVIGMDEDRGFGPNTFGIHRRALAVDYQDGISMSLTSGKVGIGTTTPSEKLHVIGNVLASGTITSSDARYKKQVQIVENATDIINKLQPVSYLFKTKEFVGQFDEKKHYGFIAQELEKTLPELVYTDNEGYKAINYTDLIAILLKSVQEQQLKVVEQEQKFSKKMQLQRKELEEQFSSEIEALKALIMEVRK